MVIKEGTRSLKSGNEFEMECRRNVINVYLSNYSCATFVCDSCECEGGGRTLDSFLSIDIQCSDSYVSKCASFNGIQLYTIRAVGRHP